MARARSFTVYLAGTDDSRNYRRCDYSGSTALVVGNERYGISRPWYEADFERVGVPMLGLADSLNVAISAPILLAEARARRKAGDRRALIASGVGLREALPLLTGMGSSTRRLRGCCEPIG